MRFVRRLWTVITLLAASACGSSPPPAPSPGPGPGTGQSITGRERIGWDQPADDNSELATFQYAIYVDGSRSVLAEPSCGTTAGANGFACSGKLPPMSNGSHTLELAAFVDGGAGDIIESSRSASIAVTVSALTAPSAGWTDDGRIETSVDGSRLRVDRLATGFHQPIDAAFDPDGRLFVAERAGRIRLFADGALVAPDALALASADDNMPLAMLSLALDRDFARTHHVFLVHTAPTTDGPVFRLSRYRELGGKLAERAVLFETAAPAGTPAAAVLRVGADAMLYLSVNAEASNGRLFRLNADGTMPRDQAGSTPAVATGIADPRGMAWDPQSGMLWIADQDDQASHLSGLSLSSPPVRATARARGTLRAAAAQLAVYTADRIPALHGEALLASPDGFIQRLRFDGNDSTRIMRAGRLLDNEVGPIHVVIAGADGAVYFLTDEALGRLTLAR